MKLMIFWEVRDFCRLHQAVVILALSGVRELYRVHTLTQRRLYCFQ